MLRFRLCQRCVWYRDYSGKLRIVCWCLFTDVAVEWKRDVMAHAQKPDSVFQRNGRVHLYRRGCQFSRVLPFLECGSAENDCSNTEWTVPSQTENCWLPTPFASFPFTSPPVRHRVPSDSVSTLPPVGSKFKCLGLHDNWRWDRQSVPKRQ